jgi:hypothetical protein
MVQALQVGKKKGKRQIQCVLGCVRRVITLLAVGAAWNAIGHYILRLHYTQEL